MMSVSVPECEKLNLKPCPFCGGTRLIIWEDDLDGTGRIKEWIECANPMCEAIGPAWRRTIGHEMAIDAWNERASG